VEPFDPSDVTWQGVSSRLATARRLISGGGALLTCVALAVLAVVTSSSWLLVPLPFLVVAAAVAWWVVGRQVRAVGYAEREDDLLVRHGIMFRDLVVVPYGRMQYVDVHAGPADQLAGIATLRLHTASPGTSAVIPGLPADEAARLRDRLTSRSDTTAGL
jgi:hypothetical protein